MTSWALPLAAAGELPPSFFHERTSDTLPCQSTEQVLLLGLGARTPHRPLRDADPAAPEAGPARRPDRLRDRLHPGPARAPPALAAAAAARRDRGPLHDPQRRLLLPAAAAHRARGRHRGDRADRLQPADHLPQHDRRPRQRPRVGQGRGPRNGPDRSPDPLAGRAAAGDPGDHRRAADRHRQHRRDRDPRGAGAAAAGWAARSSRTGSASRPTSSSPAGSRSLMALVFDVILLVVQRLATPWERVARLVIAPAPAPAARLAQGAIEFIFEPNSPPTSPAATWSAASRRRSNSR